MKNKQPGTAKNSDKRRKVVQTDIAYKNYLEPRMDSILSLFQALMSDITNNLPIYRRIDSTRDLAKITRRLENEGLSFLSNTLPSIMNELFVYLEGGIPHYIGVKLRCGYPVMFGRLFLEVYKNGKYYEGALDALYQLCVLFKKLKGPFKESVLVENMTKFVDVDSELGRIDFTSEPLQPIINRARQLIETVFVDVKLKEGDLKPRPGSGATNTPVDMHLRFAPHVLYTTLNSQFNYLDYFYAHEWDLSRASREYKSLPVKDDAVSRFQFIPKYLGKPRGICIEENEMQFFQQALKNTLYKHLEQHPATRGRINFTSQETNRVMALESSIDKAYATIDMSDASDRVARELVFRLFWNTELSLLLDSVSTRRLLLRDGKTELLTNKFAPMGSGVCFPIMAVVHWALVRAIIDLSSIADSSKLSKDVYVFGDDIIIPSTAFEAVTTYLPLFGMKINVQKSFVNGNFRESCGIHAVNGCDITPVYVNHVISNTSGTDDSTMLLSLIAKEFQFHKKGLFETSRCIQKQVHKHYGYLPFVGEASPVLGFKREGRTYDQTVDELFTTARKVRYNDDLQTIDLNVRCVVTRTGPRAEMTQWSGFLRKLLTNADKPIEIPGRLEDLMIRRGWVSLEAV